MTRKKPWNRVNLPVYATSTKTADGGNQNMHIITYAQAVSMQPKMFVCGIYHHTKTLENIQQNPFFVLQILAEQQYNLVDVLGKKSGHSIDKITRLQKRNLLQDWNGFPVLKDCIAVMQMKAVKLFTKENDATPQPDHELYLCEVIAYQNLNEGNALTLDILRDKNLIRI